MSENINTFVTKLQFVSNVNVLNQIITKIDHTNSAFADMSQTIADEGTALGDVIDIVGQAADTTAGKVGILVGSLYGFKRVIGASFSAISSLADQANTMDLYAASVQTSVEETYALKRAIIALGGSDVFSAISGFGKEVFQALKHNRQLPKLELLANLGIVASDLMDNGEPLPIDKIVSVILQRISTKDKATKVAISEAIFGVSGEFFKDFNFADFAKELAFQQEAMSALSSYIQGAGTAAKEFQLAVGELKNSFELLKIAMAPLVSLTAALTRFLAWALIPGQAYKKNRHQFAFPFDWGPEANKELDAKTIKSDLGSFFDWLPSIEQPFRTLTTINNNNIDVRVEGNADAQVMQRVADEWGRQLQETNAMQGGALP